MFKTFLFHVAILNMMCFSFYHSAIAVNLKACNHFRLYNGKAAEVRFASVCLSDWLSLLSICLFVCLSVHLSVCLSISMILITCIHCILVQSTFGFLFFNISFSGRTEDSSGNSKPLFQFCQWPHQTQSGE